MLAVEFKNGLEYFNSLFKYLDDYIGVDDSRYGDYLLAKEDTRQSYLCYKDSDIEYAEALSSALDMTAFFEIFGQDMVILALRDTNGSDVRNKFGASLALKTCTAM